MANPAKILIIYSNYYEHITQNLMRGAVGAIEKAGAQFDKIEVPGVLEIPGALAMAVQAAKNGGIAYDGYVLLGCVIRGETTHYEIVSNESARAIMDQVNRGALAVGNGIQTVENEQQAIARSSPDGKNNGGGAARAALAMISVRDQLNNV